MSKTTIWKILQHPYKKTDCKSMFYRQQTGINVLICNVLTFFLIIAEIYIMQYI